jgi:uncharacterized membrane protein YkoI
MHPAILKKCVVGGGLLAWIAGLLVMAGCAWNHPDQAALRSQAKVTRDRAAQAALAQVPGGRIKESELDSDDGRLTWWFDIAHPGSKALTEVSVDAQTGGVISVATEVPEP